MNVSISKENQNPLITYEITKEPLASILFVLRIFWTNVQGSIRTAENYQATDCTGTYVLKDDIIFCQSYTVCPK